MQTEFEQIYKGILKDISHLRRDGENLVSISIASVSILVSVYILELV